MNKIMTGLFLSILFWSGYALAETPTAALKLSVNQLFDIAAKKDTSDEEKKNLLAVVINTDVDFEAVSRRVVLRKWRKATPEQKLKFKKQFSTIMVNTYAKLLKNYTDEKVIFGKEQLKRNKYAIVDTLVVSGHKKIPVRYRLIKVKQHWKIYDFIVEGVSLVSTYRNSYQNILKRGGLDALLLEMVKVKKSKNKG